MTGPAGLRMLFAVTRRQPQKPPLHRVDPGDIGRDEVVAAALAGHHLKVAARADAYVGKRDSFTVPS